MFINGQHTRKADGQTGLVNIEIRRMLRRIESFFGIASAKVEETAGTFCDRQAKSSEIICAGLSMTV